MSTLSTLRRWFAPPVYGAEDLDRRARALWSIGWGTLLVAAVYLPAMMVLDPQSAVRRAGTLIGLAVVTITAHEASRRGHLFQASWAFVGLLLALFTQRAWITGGVHAPIAPLYLIIIMMGGVLLGGRGARYTAAGTVVGVVLLTVAELAQWIEPWQAFGSPIAMMLFLIIMIVLTVMLQRMVTRAFRANLDRARAEIAERERLQVRRTLALNAGQVVAWELDAATGMVRADEGVFKLFDLDGDPGAPFHVARIVERVHTDDLPAFAERVKRRVDQPDDQGPPAPLQFRIVRRDGTIRHALNASVILPKSAGAPPVVSGVTVDVTERRNAELERERLLHALRERIKELGLLHHVARATQRAALTDAELLHDVAQMLPAALQFPEVAAARATFGDVTAQSPGWRAAEWRLATTFNASGKQGVLEVVYTERRPDADDGPFLAEERALLNSVAEMLVAHLDSMRSRRELEELVATRTAELTESLAKLQQLEHLRDDLVKMIVHDMRGLLTVVMANLELAAPAVSGQPAEDIADATSAAQAVVDMANTLLDVSRMEEHQMPLSLAPCDLALVALASRDAVSGLDRSRAIDVTADGPVMAECDAALIRRVVDNLLSNSIKHTPAGGRITIEVTTVAGRARVAIRDEGHGVPPELRSRLFEKFVGSATKATGGTHSAGLGLAFCKLAVETHGGVISVAAAEPRGSVFWFELPA